MPLRVAPCKGVRFTLMNLESNSKPFFLQITAPIWCSLIWSVCCKWFVGPFYGTGINQSAMGIYFLLALSWVLVGLFVCTIVFSINKEIAKNRKSAIWGMYFLSLMVPFLFVKSS